jgi:hypothetical protein
LGWTKTGSDKVVSFENMPENRTGYLLRRPDGEVLEAQKGDWPAALTIAGLGQLAMNGGRLIRLENPRPDTKDTMPQAKTLFVPIQYALTD